ncbi:hypothetical protein ACFOWX_07210 [Sphingorhabdus arenilitoris]|uniref:Uncharacterized protein n=1 Tax=Sphingorhabdus arenilitoris TaxID=1490041 RepID=A0ABV8RIY3_9SPHN
MLSPIVMLSSLVITPAPGADSSAPVDWKVDGKPLLYVCADPSETIDGVFMLTIEGDAQRNLVNLIRTSLVNGERVSHVSVFPSVKATAKPLEGFATVNKLTLNGTGEMIAGQTPIGTNESIEFGALVMGASQASGNGYPYVHYKADGIDLEMKECSWLASGPGEQGDDAASSLEETAN